ncbi:hypothetical protein [Bradyrhizobium sp. WD16]|uniref:hypothetical protein n=1 Tax=Bradyrhizobium sp. WD16 TaxID=1521768 RepID=UPI0020A47453|nr:hypothetical protein [Bradyrhizobium sp. WD16]UTD29149.1 hypothetical protein DB459_21825 [Bradyrhizobium sp. WD16]
MRRRRRGRVSHGCSPGGADQTSSIGAVARSSSRRPLRSAIPRLDDQDLLLGSLEEAMISARRLKMGDLEYILKMAVMEVLRHQTPPEGAPAESGLPAAGGGPKGRR